MYLLTFQITAFSMRKVSNFELLKQHGIAVYILLNSNRSEIQVLVRAGVSDGSARYEK